MSLPRLLLCPAEMKITGVLAANGDRLVHTVLTAHLQKRMLGPREAQGLKVTQPTEAEPALE